MARRTTITIDANSAEAIFRELTSMRNSLEVVRKKIMKLLPVPYGSDAWWEKEEEEANEDIKAGRLNGPFSTSTELKTFLDSLK